MGIDWTATMQLVADRRAELMADAERSRRAPCRWPVVAVRSSRIMRRRCRLALAREVATP